MRRIGRFVGVTVGMAALVGASLTGCGDVSEVETDPTTQGSGGFTVGAGGFGGAGGCTATEELCNGVDDDCDGEVDEGCPCVAGDTQPCWSGPPDAEGVGTCTGGTQTCDETGTWGPCDGEVLPVTETCDGADDDCDGEIDEGFGTITCGLGVCQTTVEECVEGVPQPCIPGTPGVETCDGTDDDCDGEVDEGCSCVDGDMQPCYTGSAATQNVGACTDGLQTCANGQWGACQGDVTPSAEICDGVDNDCDGQTDEGNPGGGAMCATGLLGKCAAGTETCSGGQIVCQQIQQPSAETCNGIDDDCDGQVDEDNPGGGGMCSTGLLGLCAVGTFNCQNGGLVCTQNQQPSNEVCNGLDDDCDGMVDEGNPGGGGACTTSQPGVCAAGTLACQGGGLVCMANASPSAEQCNGLDDDCDGAVDEGNPGGGGACMTGQPGICSPGTLACQNGGLVCTQNQQASSEVCNGFDDDCDGMVDEGNPGGGNACNSGQLGVCAAGTTACQNGAVSCIANQSPSTEICNGLDDDCDGAVDEGNPGGGASCSTGNLGVCSAGTVTCTGGALGCVQNQSASPEVCNDGLDNDCDGLTDGADPDCGCSHALCTTGAALTDGCNQCVTDICAIDPFCCDTSWDGLCVQQVRTVCGSLTCTESQGSCPHSLCEAGPTSTTPFTSTCDSGQAGCVSQICAVDSYCCNTDWDSFCVNQVTSVCGLNCSYP